MQGSEFHGTSGMQVTCQLGTPTPGMGSKTGQHYITWPWHTTEFVPLQLSHDFMVYIMWHGPVCVIHEVFLFKHAIWDLSETYLESGFIARNWSKSNTASDELMLNDCKWK